MSAPPAMTMIVAVLLAAAVTLAGVRMLLHARAGRVTPARCVGIIVLQALAALLLHLAMFPPDSAREAGVLTVLAEDAAAGNARGIVLALPEFAGGGGVERTPDLAAALRRHPGTTHVIVRGAGLPWRDHDAARGVDLAFEPSPAPPGLVSLSTPRHVVAGQRALLRGQVAGLDAAGIELLDATGERLVRVSAAEDGHFALALQIRAAGTLNFELRVLGADDAVLDSVPVAISATPGQSLQALLLAAAPSPELRALRRWAVDAGLALESRIQLSRDVHLGGRPAFEATELRELDLLLLDERVWRTLDEAQRAAVRDAVRDGLGLLLRIGSALDEDDRHALRQLGFDARAIELDDPGVVLHPAHLSRIDAGRDAGAEDPQVLSRRPLQVTASDAAVLLRSDGDEPLALWRSEGTGRVALWWLDATYPLAQGADPAIHASLWSTVVSTLARARAPAGFDPGIDAGLHSRRVLCGVERGARVQDPEGGIVELAVDSRACAGYWPARSGWHVVTGDATRSAFHVAAEPALADRAMREATAVLASRPGRADTAATTSVPGSAWPWFLAFLATVAALWWLERRRAARTPSA